MLGLGFSWILARKHSFDRLGRQDLVSCRQSKAFNSYSLEICLGSGSHFVPVKHPLQPGGPDQTSASVAGFAMSSLPQTPRFKCTKWALPPNQAYEQRPGT